MARCMSKLTIMIITFLGLFSGTLPVVIPPASAAPPAQTEPVQGAETHTLYLPLILHGDEPAMKQWSGIHLGNISRDTRFEWHPTQFWYIDPRLNAAATWPALIVVQSNQIYEIHRDETVAGCPITHAAVRLPNAFQYLQAAAQAGSQVVIRITPSPGSFIAWDQDLLNDRRMVVTDPLGVLKMWVLNDATKEYVLTNAPADFQEPVDCTVERNGVEYDTTELYRSLQDVTAEIQAIYDLNRAFGWTEYGFEPANEPNIEWFGNIQNATPTQSHPGAWDMMDLYFYYLLLRIEEMQIASPDLQPRVFTPPMAQSEYEAGLWLEHCQKDRYFRNHENELLLYSTGYERMRNAIEASHGFSWHNYWNQGGLFEAYADCDENTQEGGHHISYHFPQWLKEHLAASGKPLIVTEADLQSPWQSEFRTPAIANKDAQPTAAADSLRNFLQIEHAALQQQYPDNPTYFALWLLNDNLLSLAETPADATCLRGSCVTDHNWHEAYQDTVDQLQTFSYSDAETALYGFEPGAAYTVNAVQMRPWFTQWWNGPEE